jgi:hypothetical protein
MDKRYNVPIMRSFYALRNRMHNKEDRHEDSVKKT